MVTRAHPWRLVGPWYRWDRAALPEDGRLSAPALQKFAGDEFLEHFLAQPQHSLAFDAQVDVVSRLDAAGAATRWVARTAARFSVVGNGAGAPATVIAGESAAALNARMLSGIAAARHAPSALRKLFLPSHDRHYLVVCELHCDMAGLPSVPREQVCQAGFVVRRRQVGILEAFRATAEGKAAACSAREAELAVLEALDEPAPRAVSSRPQELKRVLRETTKRAAQRERKRVEAGATSWTALLDTKRTLVASTRDELRDWFTEQNANRYVQGWLTGTAGAAARWTAMDAQQQVADTLHPAREQFFPLVPLVPDPSLANHDAAGRTIYFGVVPTVVAEHDPDGHARFDDQSTYEIRCFVRRHDPARPHKGGDPDCCGEVVWSQPSEAFRLAPPFDLVGTAQRPVTIQMPDLRDLAAQVAARPRGKMSPVKFVQPQHMSPEISSSAATSGSLGGPAICFFSIPLITIIALFVLNLFLPIVVLIFNLWFLLALRFCIKPQISLSADAGFDAALAAEPPGVDIAASASITLDDGTVLASAALETKMKARVTEAIVADTNIHAPAVNPVLDGAGLTALGQAFADAALLPEEPAEAPTALGYEENLVYEPHRQPQWKLASGGRG